MFETRYFLVLSWRDERSDSVSSSCVNITFGSGGKGGVDVHFQLVVVLSADTHKSLRHNVVLSSTGGEPSGASGRSFS
jgi:hypothetical protein